MKKVMISNSTDYSWEELFEYLGGYTARLRDKILVTRIPGEYYDTIVVKPV
jgi:hypothetical protein